MSSYLAHVAFAVVALATACTPQREASAPLPALDSSRLSHPQHAQVACGDCHRTTGRPGSDDHKPCDAGNCHRKDFVGEPTRLCRVCHTEITSAPVTAPLKPYPVDDAWQAEPSTFSHRRHLAAGAMEDRVGFHVTCVDCHTNSQTAGQVTSPGTERADQRADQHIDQRAEKNGLARPDHAVCARCHAAEVGLTRAPVMADCRACHQPTTRVRTRRRLIRDDLHFDHLRHRSDRAGRPIRCEDCHSQTASADDYRDHAAPRVESCVGCHDDAARTPPGMQMRSCETCHFLRSENVAALAPRSHLPLTERPLDHTLAFRRDHAEAARDATRCAACHTQMSGNPQQACDECHQTMLPADHRITWRELDHGVEAAADRERCARCHVVEFCTACHRQRPRSHGFGSFYTDHGRSARVDIRPCIVCHSESFCEPCHAGTAPRGRR